MTSPLQQALQQFDASEANLDKAFRVIRQLEALTPGGIEFGVDPTYDQLCRDYEDLLASLAPISGWRPSSSFPERNTLGKARLDASEIGEPEAMIAVEEWVSAPARELADYRHKLQRARRKLIRKRALEIQTSIAKCMSAIREQFDDNTDPATRITDPRWEDVRAAIGELEALFGTSIKRPRRWHALLRHLHFGMVQDLFDILDQDFPEIWSSLDTVLYDPNEPLPIPPDIDLGELVDAEPGGAVVAKLSWHRLAPSDFERLLFVLFARDANYEDVRWLMHTNAPDRGRDISAVRVTRDRLAGDRRERVLVQCKHKLSGSIGMDELTKLKNQVALWEPPRVDLLVVATTGRFTADAVRFCERHNQSDSALRVEPWPESHLEQVLSRSPALIAEFNLRADTGTT